MSDAKKSGLHVHHTEEMLFADAADIVEETARDAIRERGAFRWALAGGSTPKALYELIDRPPRWGRIDWSRTEIFFGDERCVPPEDMRSNFGMAWEALLKRVPLPDGAVHRIKGELPPEEAAEEYERELAEAFGGGPPRFDLVLLGLGTDGHTASLFPGGETAEEDDRLVRATESPVPPRNRVTLTLSALNAARYVVFMAVGKEKADALAWVVRDKVRKEGRLPAALVDPPEGRLVWLVDLAAAPFIKRPRRT
jgi:6-phosphogluconolactonase